MTGSDNACYVHENKGLNIADSGIKRPESQVLPSSETSESVVGSQMCRACGGPLTRRWQVSACSRSCAGKLAPVRRQDGAFNGNYRGGISRRRYRYTRAFYAANPHILRAHRKVAAAIRAGVLVRPDACAHCGIACRPDAHHADYGRPLDVVWLCRPCHCRENAPRKDRRHPEQSLSSAVRALAKGVR
jgi:hypothetical protein